MEEKKNKSGGVDMATSSIFSDFVIKDEKTLERFIKISDEADKTPTEKIRQITDEEMTKNAEDFVKWFQPQLKK